MNDNNIEYFPRKKSIRKPNSILEGQFISDGNFVHPSATNVIVTGINNFVGSGCRNVSVFGSSGCTVIPGVQDVSIFNSSGVTVSQSGTTVMNGAVIPAYGFTTSSIVKIPLSTTQLKSLLTTPIDAGITVPSGYFISNVTGSLYYDAGDGLLSLGVIYIRTKTLSGSDVRLFNTTVPSGIVWGDFLSAGNSNNTLEAKGLEIIGDADSGAGTGTAIVYLKYDITAV